MTLASKNNMPCYYSFVILIGTTFYKRLNKTLKLYIKTNLVEKNQKF